MSNHAHELSLKAGELVQRAARIQRNHVGAQRADYYLAAASRLVAPEIARSASAAPASASELARRAGEMAARAARIGHDHVMAERERGVTGRNGAD